tara:strand:+ start:1815 stop:2258 length:444 start_codon:yes stop_codon:yes gene_type:complete
MNRKTMLSDSNRFNTTTNSSWRTSHDLCSSFRYAFNGLFFAIRTQRNFRIHLFIGSIAFALGLWLKLNVINFAVLVLIITFVIVLELINTAIESVVDLSIGGHFHPLARTAKDCSAASVLVASIASLIIGSFLILPPFFQRIGFYSA